jgi:hypothetical protein
VIGRVEQGTGKELLIKNNKSEILY